MRSLDDFYKYIEKQEQALRTQAEATPSPVPNPPPAPPPRGIEPPAPSRDAEGAREGAKGGEVRGSVAMAEAPPVAALDIAMGGTPAPARPSPAPFVPPPLPPRPARASRYESILPPHALRPGAKNNGAAPSSPVTTLSVPRIGENVPIVAPEHDAPKNDPAVPDLEAYIPSLREDTPTADSPQEIQRPDYLPPIVGEQEPPLVADAPARPSGNHRPRRVRRTAEAAPSLPGDNGDVVALWERLPRHIQLLVGMAAPREEVAQKYYTRGFKESRQQLIERLLDPTLTLEDTARVLGVCPTTVRRYTNRGVLPHHRTVGQQRRFRLSDVLAFLEQNGGQNGGMEGRKKAAGNGAQAFPTGGDPGEQPGDAGGASG